MSDTPNAPEEGQATEGQATTPANEPDAGSQEPTAEERLAQIERDYKELQRDHTRKSQKIKELERSMQAPQSPAPEEEDEFGSYIRKSVAKELAEFEARQEQRRMAEEMIRETAEQHDIPVKELRVYYRKLEEAAQDPHELMDVVAGLYRAEHTDKAIGEAKRAAQTTVERNARGVTSVSSAPKPGEEEKPISKMTDEELEEYVTRTHGVAKPDY